MHGCGFKFQDSVCNVIIVWNVDYPCIIHNISKSEAINLSKNYVLEYCGYT